jgi:EmrB/QacA subfamily drug resistance transporter
MSITEKNPWLIFFVTAFAACMASLDVGIVNIALPTITQEIGHNNLLLSQWIISSYLFVICIFVPLAGKLGDIYSRKNIYLIGFVLFTLSSFLCGISATLVQLIIFRSLQGIGAAMIFANNQPIIIATIPHDKQGKALGLNSMMTGLGVIAGPGLGGLILTYFNWSYIFFVNIPFGIIGCLLGLKILPKISQETDKNIDFGGLILFALAMGALLLILTINNKANLFSWRTLLLVAIMISTSIAFYFKEKTAKNPMVDLNLFKNRKFSYSILLVFFVSIVLAVNNVLLPFYLDMQLKMPEKFMGLIMLIPPVFVIILAPICGHLADKAKQNILTFTGLSFIALALGLDGFLNETSFLWFLITCQILFGIGVGLFQSPNNYTIMKSIPDSLLSSGGGIASLMRNFGRIFGTVSGTTIFVLIQSIALHHKTKVQAFNWGFSFSLFTAALIMTIALVIAKYFAFAQNKDR